MSRPGRWLLALLLFAQGLVGHIESARAGGSSAVLAEGLRLYKEGRRLARGKQLKQALAKYLAALRIFLAEEGARRGGDRSKLRSKRLTLLYIIGRTHHLLGELEKARKAYRGCLAGKPRPRVRRAALKRLMQVVPRLLGTVWILSRPKGATVVLVGEHGNPRTGETPFSAQVEPGRYRVKVYLKGFHLERKSFGVGPRTSVYQRVLMKKIGGGGRSRSGAAAVAPAGRGKAGPGEIRAGGTTAAGLGRVLAPVTRAHHRTLRVTAWGTAGLATVGLVVAGVFGVKYIVDRGKLLDVQGTSDAVYDYEDAMKTDRTAALVSLGVGAAAGIASGVLFVLTARKRAPSLAGQPGIRLMPTSGGAAVLVCF